MRTRVTLALMILLFIRCQQGSEFFPSFYGNHLWEQVVYGEDNRVDPYEVPNSGFYLMARSTVALVHKDKIIAESPQGLHINLIPYGEKYNLCEGEKFYHQGTAPYCSGFLIAPQRIATAGHCVSRSSACEDLRVIFDFGLYGPEDLVPEFIPAEKVYRCQRIVSSHRDAFGADFAVIELDRAVTDRSPLALRPTGRPSPDDPLVLIGHPSGLPVKIAPGAHVREVQEAFMVTNVDAFAINSGSAVFNADTGWVEGILVRGEFDFSYKGNCRVPKQCEAGGCRGEDATLISFILPYL